MDPEETWRDKIRDWRTRADGRRVAGGTTDKNSRFLRGESISLFLSENRRCPERVRSLAAIWIFCWSSRIDASLNLRPPDDHAQPGCTAAQTDFPATVQREREEEAGTLIAAIKNADRCGESTTDPPSSLTFAKSYILAR